MTDSSVKQASIFPFCQSTLVLVEATLTTPILTHLEQLQDTFRNRSLSWARPHQGSQFQPPRQLTPRFVLFAQAFG